MPVGGWIVDLVEELFDGDLSEGVLRLFHSGERNRRVGCDREIRIVDDDGGRRRNVNAGIGQFTDDSNGQLIDLDDESSFEEASERRRRARPRVLCPP